MLWQIACNTLNLLGLLSVLGEKYMVRQLQLLAVVLIAGLFFAACDSGSSNNGGTTGGSGETQTDSATDTSSSNDSTEKATEKEPDTPAASSDIWLDARSFDCTSNWTDRDGAWGLKAYSGSGTCKKSFPGVSGTYKLTFYAVTEFDGKSPYRVSINGTTIKEGTYPLSSPLGCDCPIDDWRSVCPDKNYNIDLGVHVLSQGDIIELWGDDVYPCGEHGAYTKWDGIRAVKQ